MAARNLAERVSQYIRRRAYSWVGRDPVTRMPVAQRADLRTIGSRYGGWTVPTQLLGPRSVCYCVGCGEDITFDLGLIAQFGCDVHAFDPTPRSIEHVRKNAAGDPRYHFTPVGLWDKAERLRFYVPSNPAHVSHSLVNLQKTTDYIEVPVERLSALMARNGHERLDLLKLDIEGAEYKVLDSIFEDGVEIRILCIEFDEYWNPLDGGFLDRIRSYVERLLAAGYDMIDAPGNGNYTFLKHAASVRQPEASRP